MLERWTKAAVMASAVAALLVGTLSIGRETPQLPAVALLVAVVAYLAARMSPERAAGATVACGYVVPALCILILGRFRPAYTTPWTCALVGAMAATIRAAWQYPPRFRFALVSWALAVALTWPLVALRELDWMPSLLWVVPPTPTSAVPGKAVFIAEVAQVHLLGLLWIDWLFGRFRENRALDFERVILRPLLVSAVLAAMLAVYQGFVDLRFLSLGRWPDLRRASGALADANASGSLSALWVSIPLGMAATARTRWASVRLALAAVLLCLAVWATGSRTALLGAVVGLAAGMQILVMSTGWRLRMAVTAAVVVASVAAALVAMRPSGEGPIRRAQSLLPNLSSGAIRGAAWELWARNGYGLIAVEMVKDAPLEGIGVGAFHALSEEYDVKATGEDVPADNAQNWFRHQLAELGLLGSVGWISWVALFSWVLLRNRAAPEHHARAVSVKYALVGFGMASLVGMPGQSMFVALTCWTFAGGLLLMTAPAASAGANRETISRRGWTILAIALAIGLAAMTLRSGWRELRPPFRAARFDLDYRYGFYQPFNQASGQSRTTQHAVWVSRAPSKWLKLTLWVDHPDANERPVLIQVWIDDRRMIRKQVPRQMPFTSYLRVPGDNKRFVLETSVDRTFRPSDGGYADVGLSMSWEFVEAAAASGGPGVKWFAEQHVSGRIDRVRIRHTVLRDLE